MQSNNDNKPNKPYSVQPQQQGYFNHNQLKSYGEKRDQFWVQDIKKQDEDRRRREKDRLEYQKRNQSSGKSL